MVPQGRKHDLEELLAGTRWVRGLAGALVSDPSTAEDVAQEAWLVALSRPAAAREPRAWLAGVVKRLAWRQARSAERARQREATVARAEGVPSTEALVERSELQEHLSAAVRALDEPYRTTVLLHYSEGLSLEEIARTQGVPASTVRTRLARALERLRQRLDRTHGNRATWLAAFAPLAGAPALPSITTTSIALGSLSMGAKTGFGIAAIAAGVAVVAVTFALRKRDREVSAPSADDHSAAIDSVASASASPGMESAQVEGRASIEVDPPLAANRGPLLVYGSLRSSDGEALSDASVLFWNDQGETKNATIARESWSAVGLTPGTWNVDVSADGYYPLREEIALSGLEQEARRDFALEKARSLCIRFVDAEGQAIVATNPLDQLVAGLSVVATSQPPGARVENVHDGSPWRGDAGRYVTPRRFQSAGGVPPGCSGVLTLTRPPPVCVSAILGDRVLETRLDSGAGDEMAFVIDLEAQKVGLASLALRAVDSRTGEPLEGGVNLDSHVALAAGARLQQGRILIEGLLAGLHDLSIETREHQRYQRTLRLEPGQTLDLGDIPLAAARSLKGRVVGEDGKEVEGTLLFISSDLIQGPLDLENLMGWSGGAEFNLPGMGNNPWVFLRNKEYAANPLLLETDEEGTVTAIARKGTSILLRPGTSDQPIRSLAIADSSGRPFWQDGVWKEIPIRLRLVPGSYQLLEGHDEVFTLLRSFEVGAEPVVLEP
jgi:RNA polymerase sigma factor (sigma-70 family)